MQTRWQGWHPFLHRAKHAVSYATMSHFDDDHAHSNCEHVKGVTVTSSTNSLTRGDVRVGASMPILAVRRARLEVKHRFYPSGDEGQVGPPVRMRARRADEDGCGQDGGHPGDAGAEVNKGLVRLAKELKCPSSFSTPVCTEGLTDDVVKVRKEWHAEKDAHQS